MAISLLVVAVRFDEPGVAEVPDPSAIPVADLLAGPAEGFSSVNKELPLRFPEDHAAHPQFRTEAWLLTGILRDADSRLRALQLNILRVALAAESADGESRWAARDAYAGFVAVTDPYARKLDVAKRASRGAAGLAGTRLDPLRIWIDDWRLGAAAPEAKEPGFAMRVATADTELELTLSSRVLPLDGTAPDGTMIFGDAPFILYTQPRLNGRGTIVQGSRGTAVAGRFMLEHAWGELPPPGSPVARDRFTLFIDDGRELTLIRSHRIDGSGTPGTVGVVVASDGTARAIPEDAIDLAPSAYWEDEANNARYPVEWTLEIRDPDMDLRLVPEYVEQAGFAWSPFWMSPVRFEDNVSNVSGTGVVVLDGYQDVGKQ